MVGSSFDDKDRAPDDASLARTLGRTKAHWDAVTLLAHEADEGVTEVWKYYGKKHGWQLKLMQRRRALLFMVPHEGRFLAGLALRDSAMDAVRNARLPAELVREIETATPFQEGRPARVEVTSLRDVRTVKKLIALKLAT